LETTTQSKQSSPNGRNFTQSGHPGWNQSGHQLRISKAIFFDREASFATANFAVRSLIRKQLPLKKS
jgi:hypothetical protein